MGNAYVTISTYCTSGRIFLCDVFIEIDLNCSIELGEVDSNSSTMTSEPLPKWSRGEILVDSTRT